MSYTGTRAELGPLEPPSPPPIRNLHGAVEFTAESLARPTFYDDPYGTEERAIPDPVKTTQVTAMEKPATPQFVFACGFLTGILFAGFYLFLDTIF